ncbi:MAG TPA: hypothetical protein VF331_08330 [Polyangiales bacterium]
MASLLPAGLVLYAGVLAWRPLDEADVFFHLTLGRAVLRHGARMVPEPTAFTDFTDPAVAAEWGWSVLSYAVQRLGGFSALSLLGVLLSMAAAFTLLRLVRGYANAEQRFIQVFVALLVICAVQARVAVRPQLLLLVGLPVYLLLTRSYARAPLPQRLRLGLGLVAGVVVWAQFHGSFVLAPAIFVIQVARRPSAAERATLRVDGLILLLLLMAMGTSAYGPDIAHFIGSHAAGDAPRFVAEMAATTWPMLDPAASPFVAAYWLLLLTGAAGIVIARSLFWRELLLSALGGALLATANRFVSEAAILAVPLAARASTVIAAHLQPIAGVAQQRVVVGLLTALGTGLLWSTASSMHELRWPVGRLGLGVGAFPTQAPGVLTGLPAGTAVFTDYPSSAPLGFLVDGRLRTFVDGRTPLYFDDTDFAVEREMLRDGQAMRNGLARYHARAAVVRRDSQACVELARLWPVALVEPLYTTFVADAPPRPLTTIRPCGPRYVETESCAHPSLLGADIAVVRASGAPELAHFLRIESVLRCGGDARSALGALAALAPSARAYGHAFGRVRAQALMQASRFDEAAELMIELLRSGDDGAVNLLRTSTAGGMPLGLVARVLMAYVKEKSDDTDVGVRAVLADVCARIGDVECARFNAARVAVRGRRSEALQWIAQHHPSARVRNDARRWLELLSASPAP